MDLIQQYIQGYEEYIYAVILALAMILVKSILMIVAYYKAQNSYKDPDILARDILDQAMQKQDCPKYKMLFNSKQLESIVVLNLNAIQFELNNLNKDLYKNLVEIMRKICLALAIQKQLDSKQSELLIKLIIQKQNILNDLKQTSEDYKPKAYKNNLQKKIVLDYYEYIMEYINPQ